MSVYLKYIFFILLCMTSICSDEIIKISPNIKYKRYGKVSNYRQSIIDMKNSIKILDGDVSSKRVDNLYKYCAQYMIELDNIGTKIDQCYSQFKSHSLKKELIEVRKSGNELYKMCSGNFIDLWSKDGRDARLRSVDATPTINRKIYDRATNKDLKKPTFFS